MHFLIIYIYNTFFRSFCIIRIRKVQILFSLKEKTENPNKSSLLNTQDKTEKDLY